MYTVKSIYIQGFYCKFTESKPAVDLNFDGNNIHNSYVGLFFLCFVFTRMNPLRACRL